MQIDKFYKAQELRAEILKIETAMAAIGEAPFDVKALQNLNVDVKKSLSEKTADLLKKELQKIIRQKEKEFSDL